MANRYYSSTNGKLSAPKPPQAKKGVDASLGINVKNVGPRRNNVGFTEVKAYPVQRMPDDFSTQGMMGGAASGASMGSYFGPWGAAIGGIAGGLLGGFTGGKGGQQQGGGGGLPGLPF